MSVRSTRHMMIMAIWVFFALLMLPSWSFSDTISAENPIRDDELLLSDQKRFTLGFFSPGNSSNRYVGIWYNFGPEPTVVWVANRDKPINDTSGVLAVDGKGGLVINAGAGEVPVWSANVSLENGSAPVARLLDVGNLVLSDESGRVVWQSFDHPGDTMLPDMTLGVNRRSGRDLFMTSWKSADDPGTGSYSFGIDPSGYSQLILFKDGVPRWRAGTWTGHKFSGVPAMTKNFIFNVTYVDNEEQVTYAYSMLNKSIYSRMGIKESGIVYRTTWNDRIGEWDEFWSAPTDICDNYKQCGPNGYCDPSTVGEFMCKCLPGFEPKSTQEWFLRDGSGGCVQVERARTCGSKEDFVTLEGAKVPDTMAARVMMSLSLAACKQECLRNCSCTAYANAKETAVGIGCLMWYGDLLDTRTYPSTGQDLYIRVDAITLREYRRKSTGFIKKTVKLTIALVSSVVLFLILLYALWWAKKRRKAKNERNTWASLLMSPDYSGQKDHDKNNNAPDLPFFSQSTIVTASDNFSFHNKLGEGGFGPVYKGILPEGKEIAIKRLSKHSGQGIVEFKNEVMLIAKLQHRNLVSLVGYCIHKEEKMLIYEYLPNKSLDLFIFDEANRKLLDWEKRFEIIFGVARGLLYLHQDSRVIIVHRDLKASNVLLDAAMKPKIADFGMARIFGGDQIEANTNRVVGTYGYMSPEYAMAGRFSTKSDVYSFGVLLLEIVTGKKNSTYSNERDPNLNLVGHVWALWAEGRFLENVDPFLNGAVSNEALKCLQIGLLCSQDYADDRPSMSTVVFMLGNDAPLPNPKKPAFVLQNRVTGIEDQSVSEGAMSVNEVTCTIVDAR